jgi:hypothetical protein
MALPLAGSCIHTLLPEQGMLQEFIDYLKAKKISPLDEVAAEFKLKSQEVVNRVEGLEAMGRVTGLLDDRGKFIYISIEEMEAVAKWIKLQGRVSIADLAAESNRYGPCVVVAACRR